MKKLSISLVAFILLSMLLLGRGFDLVFENLLDTEHSDLISNYQELGQQLARGIDNSTEPQQFIAQWQSDDDANKLQLLPPNALPLPEELWQQLYHGEALILESANGLTLHFWLPRHQQLLTFQPKELATSDQQPWLELILTLLFYLAILALLLLWLWPLITSLQQLQKNTRAYGKGDFSARIAPRKLSYIRDIEQTVNNMADQIETLINDNKLISSAVSHDLRTPLARLRFGIDMLTDTEDAAAREKYQNHLSADIDEMQALVEALLQYARLEQRMIHLQTEPIDANTIIDNILLQMSAENIRVESLSKHHFVLAQSTYFRMLLQNILSNALHYGGGEVLIRLTDNNRMLRIEIHDNGPGIKTELRKDLFKPFIRGELKHNHKGYGIGLAIAERICHWHDGKIEIGDSDILGGAVFLIQLPAANS